MMMTIPQPRSLLADLKVSRLDKGLLPIPQLGAPHLLQSQPIQTRITVPWSDHILIPAAIPLPPNLRLTAMGSLPSPSQGGTPVLVMLQCYRQQPRSPPPLHENHPSLQ